MTSPAKILILVFLIVCPWIESYAQTNRRVSIQSPDGRIEIQLQIADAPPAVRYSVRRDGKLLIEPSALDVRLAKVGSIGTGASILGVEERTVDESSKIPWGKTSTIHNLCRSATVRFESTAGIKWNLELRAYDDAVSLQYEFPAQEKLKEIVIQAETTEFRLSDNPDILYLPLNEFTTSHEGLYDRKALDALPPNQLFDMPLLATWPDGTAAAITEAHLRDYAGMYLERKSDNPSSLCCRLSPLPGRSKVCVVAKTPHRSPWRVILLADQAGLLIESDTILCLNEPAPGDYSWAEPGKTTFPWWNGEIEHGLPPTPERNFAVNKKYIDFCAKYGITYHGISTASGGWPWFVQAEKGFGRPYEDTDILTPRPDFDLQRILDYAREQGVGIRFWVNWKPLSEHLEKAFSLYEKWGIRGLMVDFMDRDDQEMVQLQERILQSAARHKLHIQFHGAYKPTGEHRTYPNMFNREGVLNLEYLKWSDRCAPPHNVNVAYTRLLAGPTDYHLGGFRSLPRDQFQPRDELPFVLGTRCHQLALYVVLLNPMPMVCDVPSAYEGQPGFEFLTEVPTTWDETRFVVGTVGEYVIVARRKGKNWYLGGITNWTARTLNVPLEFLGNGKYVATIYQDASLDGTHPNAIRKDRREVSSSESLNVELASGGGTVAVLHRND